MEHSVDELVVLTNAFAFLLLPQTNPLHCLLSLFLVNYLQSGIVDCIKVIEFLSIIVKMLSIIDDTLDVFIVIISFGEVRGISVSAYWHEGCFHLHQLLPLDGLKEGMVLYFIYVFGAQPLIGVQGQKSVKEIFGFLGDLIFLLPDPWVLEVLV